MAASLPSATREAHSSPLLRGCPALSISPSPHNHWPRPAPDKSSTAVG